MAPRSGADLPLSDGELRALRGLIRAGTPTGRPGDRHRWRRQPGAVGAVLMLLLALLPLAGPLAGQAAPLALTDTCNGTTITLPFSDVAPGGFFCAIFQALNLGITAGTTATTYSPTTAVTRDQMAAFTSRTLDNALKRGSQRAALGRWYLPDYSPAGYDLPATTLPGGGGNGVTSDGQDVWVASSLGSTVSRVAGSDGFLTGTWNVPSANQLVAALNRVFVTSTSSPGRVYRIDPAVVPTATVVATLTSNLANGIAFDGTRLWTASGVGNAVTIITPTTTLPYASATITGFSGPAALVSDGTAVWVTEPSVNRISRLSPAGAILQSTTVGNGPGFPVFDGTNLWVPTTADSSVSVVRAIGNSAVPTGTVVATLSGNGLSNPVAAAFDGERVLVTNAGFATTVVSLWRASDLAPLGGLSVGGTSAGAASDGRGFWVVLAGAGKLVRY